MKQFNPNDEIREKVERGMKKCKAKINSTKGKTSWVYYYSIFYRYLLEYGDDVFTALSYAIGVLASDSSSDRVFKWIFGEDFLSLFYEWDINEQYDECMKVIRNTTYYRMEDIER